MKKLAIKKSKIERKNFNTEIGAIESQYGVNFGVASDKKLGTFLKERGYESLSDLLKRV